LFPVSGQVPQKRPFGSMVPPRPDVIKRM